MGAPMQRADARAQHAPGKRRKRAAGRDPRKLGCQRGSGAPRLSTRRLPVQLDQSEKSRRTLPRPSAPAANCHCLTALTAADSKVRVGLALTTETEATL